MERGDILTRDWLTAAELAALGLPGLPGTKRGLNKMIRQRGWKNTPHARKRRHVGGGWEYHVSLLSDGALEELMRRRAEARAAAEKAPAVAGEELPALPEAEAASREIDLRRISQAGMAELDARQRQVAEARAALLTEAEGRRMRHGWRERRALASLVADYEAGRLDADLQRLAAMACERKRPSLRSLQRWARRLREGGVAALAPKPKRRCRALDEIPWLKDFLRYYQRPAKPSIAHALEMMARDGLTPPSYDQARRVLKRLSLPAQERGRDGRLAIRKYLPYVARDTSGLLPTAIYTADGTTFDAEVEHPVSKKPFKPEVTTILDVATRKVVGVSFGMSENKFEVADALRRACVEHGIPAIFYVDRGPGYKNRLLDDEVTGLCARLGITKAHSLPQNAQARGVIESFQKHWNRFAKELPSYMGAGMDREAAKRFHLITRKEIAQLGRSRRLPEWQAFVRAALDYIERYNNRPHSGLPKITDPETGRRRHMTPNEAWAKAVQQGFEPLKVEAAEADDLFRPMVERTVRRGLVSFASQEYYAPELEELHGQKVFVGYDLTDASRVWVREAVATGEGLVAGRLICVARWDAHKRSYFPESVIEQAEKRRVQAAIARKQRKIAALEEQLTPKLIEADRAAPLNVVELPARAPEDAEPLPASELPAPEVAPEMAQETAPEASAEVVPLSRPDGRPVFSDELEHVRWLLAHPDRVTESDRRALMIMLDSPSTLAWLEMEGVSQAALWGLLQGACVSVEEKEAAAEGAAAASE